MGSIGDVDDPVNEGGNLNEHWWGVNSSAWDHSPGNNTDDFFMGAFVSDQWAAGVTL